MSAAGVGSRPRRVHERNVGLLPLATLLLTCAVCASALATEAQGTEQPADEPYGDRPIEDNSFLIEEAYNQEKGVIQHIGTFMRPTNGRGWVCSFTEEWPAGGQRHQLSATLLAASVRDGDVAHTGLGDLAFNYRYQLLGRGRTWIAPRLSLLAPTGDARRGLGAGGWGFQLSLPASVRVSRGLVAHSNAGCTLVSRAAGPDGSWADTSAFNLGQSAIWLAAPWLNLMVEATWTSTQEVLGGGRTRRHEAALLSPGVRFAINTPSGLQIVPGVAFPLGVGPSAGERSWLFYLSFEHPLRLLGH